MKEKLNWTGIGYELGDYNWDNCRGRFVEPVVYYHWNVAIGEVVSKTQ